MHPHAITTARTMIAAAVHQGSWEKMERMPKISEGALKEVRMALEQYESEVKTSKLRLSSQATRVGEVARFVRWLADRYSPGQGLK